jgi:hypothetical protein
MDDRNTKVAHMGLSDVAYLSESKALLSGRETMHPYCVVPPVRGVQVYRNDVVVIRDDGHPSPNTSTRNRVSEFSKASRARLAFVACNTDVVFKTMITLTYPREFPSDGTLVKKHLYNFLKWVQRYLGTIDYLWFLEFQKRGAPHIHLLVSRETPSTLTDRQDLYQAVARAWFRIVGSNDGRHLKAGTRVERIRKPDGAARYAVKYAFKMRQKAVPPGYQDVGRFWGHTKAVKPIVKAEIRCTEDDIRGALEGWDYAPSDDRCLYKVLYGVADRFQRDTR